jgi:hypothetical protein
MFKGPDSVLVLLKNSAKAVEKEGNSTKNYGGFSGTKIKAVFSYPNARLYTVDKYSF